MQKAIILITLLLFVIGSFGQQSTTTPAPKPDTDYLQKSKKQKTAAWILLGGATIMMITGGVIWSNAVEENVDPDNPFSPLIAPATTTKGTGLIFAGLLVSAGSIPLFIASGKNRRRAASLSLGNMKTQQIKNSSMVYRPIPAVSLKISL